MDHHHSLVKRCPFCERILMHEFSGMSNSVIDFEPLNPVAEGHRLFVPNVHQTWIGHGADKWAGICAQRAAEYAMLHSVGNFNIITSFGPDATQTVEHLHVHLVPRKFHDGLALPWS